jgi:hypothetical protein
VRLVLKKKKTKKTKKQKLKAKGLGDRAELVEHFPSKLKTPSSIPSTAKEFFKK